MKLTAATGLLTFCDLTMVSPAQARNAKYTFPIAAKRQSSAASAGFGIYPSVNLYFGSQTVPGNAELLGSASATGKAGISKKEDSPFCQASFVQALQQLQKDAKSVRAIAVANIVGYYQNDAPRSSEEAFDPWAGSFSTILILKGDFATVPT